MQTREERNVMAVKLFCGGVVGTSLAVYGLGGAHALKIAALGAVLCVSLMCVWFGFVIAIDER